MDEQTIVERLGKNVPPPPVPSALEAPEVLVDEQSSLPLDPANELALLRLGNMLGVVNADAETSTRLRFVYEQLTAVASDTSNDALMASAEDYLLRLGIKFREDRFMRLYLWLKLNQERQAIEQEMAHVGQPAA